MKKRVIGFFLMLLAFAAVLILIQFLQFGKLIGFVALDNQPEETLISIVQDKEFNLNIENYYREKDFLDVNYILTELSGNSQIIFIDYTLSDKELNKIAQGQQEVFINKDASVKYVLNIPIPQNTEGDFSLNITAWNGKTAIAQEREIIILPAKITGMASSSNSKYLISNLGVVLISVIFLFFALKFIYNHHNRITQELSRNRIDRGLIKIDLS